MNTSFQCRIRRIRPGIAAVSMIALLAGSASAAKLSGTISIRNGDTQGPFRVYVIRAGLPGLLAGTAVRSTPGAWEVGGLLDGNYLVLGWADQDNNSTPDRAEPVGFHGTGTPQRVAVSGGHNVAGVDIVLEPINFAAELRGRITYGGTARGRVWVFPHVGSDYDPLNVRGLPWTLASPGDYRTFAFQSETFYVTAYIDVNGNMFHDDGEPIGTSRAVDVTATPNAVYSNVDIVLYDSVSAVQGRTWSQVKSLYQD